MLYLVIAVSFGYVAYAYYTGYIPLWVLLPFILNLFFNFLFTPLQFRLRNFALASVDIILVLLTLVWALVAVDAYAPWVTYVNLPYVAWVCFATVLQLTVTKLNRSA